MSGNNIEQSYRYLDTEEDREGLLKDIRQVRKAVVEIREIVPEDQWYTPRYHNWSLAAMLGHLQLMDTLSMWQIQSALLGLRAPVSNATWNGFNNAMAQVFKNRVVETTVRGIQNKEKTIEKFILNMPVERFTVQVYHPPLGKYLTVEQAIQALFLYHWEEHLRTMRLAEGLYYEPPTDTMI
ncbi:MAG: hypothetical protein K8L99_34765 [Anaerolineae bacterium]|nr:hypothetical protein [Anaerolineae bacterium]